MNLLRTMLLLVATLAAVGASSAAAPPAVGNPRLAALPAGIRAVVAVRPFRVATPWPHEWRADRPEVREGWIVVLTADPALVRPRQTEQAVLMAGAMTLEVVHVAPESGTVIAILPRDPAGDRVEIDALPFHVASPALPESLSVGQAEAKRAAAVAAGIGPRPAAEWTRARAAGGTAIDFRDREELDRSIAALMRTFMPGESARADELEGRIDSEPRPAVVPAS